MAVGKPQSPPEPFESPATEKLDSWKEIAAYLKRDESTVRRWEKEGLPVHRHTHKKKATVYAHKSEIDVWWNDGHGRVELVETATAGRRWRVVWWATAVIFLMVLAIWFALTFRKEASQPVPAHIIQVTTLPGLEDSPAWSPDGRSLAYVSDAAGNLDIYVEQIGSGQAIRITDSAADDAQPAWSPDGSRIAFVSARAYPEKHLSALIGMARLYSFFGLRNGDVWVMPALGGTARRIAQDAYYPAWSPDGKRVVYAAPREGRWGLWIQEVDAPSEPRSLAVGALSVATLIEPSVIQPAWSPDGKWVAFTGGRDPFLRIFVVPREGGQAQVVTEADANALLPSWSPDGRWLYFSSERSGRVNLYKIPFQDGRAGPLHQVTAGGGEDLQARLDPQGKRIAYSIVRAAMDLWEYDLKSGHATRLTSENTLEDNARPSPDGTWLAFASNRLGGNHLWLLNRRTGGLSQVSTIPNLNLQVPSHWSWDGRYLFYLRSTTPGRGNTIWQYEVSTGASRKVYEGAGGSFCISADDKFLLVDSGGQPVLIHRIELASGKREVLVQLAAGSGWGGDLECSPDGRWVAFHVQRSDDRDIWLMPSAGGTPRQLTSGDNEDSHPAWSADSRLIYFVRNHHDIYAVPRTGGEAKPVTHYRSFSITLDYPAVSGDGKKLLFTRDDKTGDIYLLDQSPD